MEARRRFNRVLSTYSFDPDNKREIEEQTFFKEELFR